MKRPLKKGLLVALALAVAGLLVATSGIISVKASDGHWPLTSWMLRFSMQRSMATHGIGLKPPERLDDPGLVLKGATHFEFSCRGCHGSPASPPARVTQTMLPRPAELSARADELSPKQLFQIVKHGVKFTGMPAFPSQQRDDEVWAVVAFLKQLPGISAEEYRELVQVAAPIAHHRLPETAVLTDTFERVVQNCAQCHGHDGRGRGTTIPSLAGQRVEYLHQTLRAYQQEKRQSGIMEPLVATLDDATLRRLAEHYAELPAAPEPKTPAISPDDVRAIAEGGIPARRIPACLECHDASGRRTSPAYPSLAGQKAPYLAAQLKLFKDGHRGGGDYAHLMQPIAARLEPEEMEALAKYFEQRGR